MYFEVKTRLETLKSSGTQEISKEYPRNSRISQGILNDLYSSQDQNPHRNSKAPKSERFYVILWDLRESERFWGILWDSAKFYKIQQDFAGFCEILRNSDTFCKILHDSMRCRKFLQDSMRFQEILQDSARFHEIP